MKVPGALPVERRGNRRRSPAVTAFSFAGGDVGFLLVHGLTGSPHEMRFLGKRLHASGFSVRGVRLAGHGTRVEDLEPCRWPDWYRSVEDGLDALRSNCRHVIAVGLSLGGLLVMRLASLRSREVDALVLLAPALELNSPWPTRLASLVRPVLDWLPADYRYWVKGASDIADAAARCENPAYRRIPLRSVAELAALQAVVRDSLARVCQPTLVVQGRQDRTVSMNTLTLLQRGLPDLRGSVILPRSHHVMTVDVEKDRVVEEVLRFARLAVAGGSGARAARRRTDGG